MKKVCFEALIVNNSKRESKPTTNRIFTIILNNNAHELLSEYKINFKTINLLIAIEKNFINCKESRNDGQCIIFFKNNDPPPL